jgi:prepilin-type N-terminal cleavage/methylation domain-containing protein
LGGDLGVGGGDLGVGRRVLEESNPRFYLGSMVASQPFVSFVVGISSEGVIVMKTKLCRVVVQRFTRVKSDHRGFTLLETMIALGILLIGAVGALSLFSYGLKATATSKYITAATNIARAKLEEVKNTPFQNITTTYPNDSSYNVENASLPEGATWTVSYPDGIGANPLNISLVVSWQDEGGRTSQVELRTLVTSP